MEEFVSQNNNERPSYAQWLQSLKAKVENATRDEEAETRWRLQYKS